MQRLVRGRSPRRDERGATLVFVAIVLVVLMGFVALAIDVGALWSDKKQLQNGADAAALAIASDCSKGVGACGDPDGTAGSYATTNKLDASATGTVVALNESAGSVTVETNSTRQLWFAPIIGIPTADVKASATARWGYTKGDSTLPFTLSKCQFYWQTGTVVGAPPSTTTEFRIDLKTKAKDYPTTPLDCGTQAAHNEVAGGFGWLSPDGACLAATDSGGWVSSDPGLPEPSCLSLTQDQIVKIPLFDEATGSGSNADYHIYGYAAFKITGWCFNHSEVNALDPCNGDNRHLRGYFVAFTDQDSDHSDTGGVNLGAPEVWLDK